MGWLRGGENIGGLVEVLTCIGPPKASPQSEVSHVLFPAPCNCIPHSPMGLLPTTPYTNGHLPLKDIQRSGNWNRDVHSVAGATWHNWVEEILLVLLSLLCFGPPVPASVPGTGWAESKSCWFCFPHSPLLLLYISAADPGVKNYCEGSKNDRIYSQLTQWGKVALC